jgi:hypothetical protein
MPPLNRRTPRTPRTTKTEKSAEVPLEQQEVQATEHTPSTSSRTDTNKDDTTMNGNNEANEKAKRAEANKKLGSVIDKISYWFVFVVTIPFRFLASFLEKFVDRDAPGVTLLGALVFFTSIIYTADGYWQASGNPPIFPLFAPDWQGWNIVFLLNPFFWALIPVVFIMQLAQSETLRGYTASEAKAKRDSQMQYETGEAPQGRIKMASIYHKQYVNAGVRQNKFVSFVALFSVVVDFIMAFAARNPFDYGQPGMFWVVVFWNLFTIVIAEAGYMFWRSHK